MSLRKVIRHLFHPHRGNNHRPRILHPEGIFGLFVLAIGFALLLRPTNTLVLHYGNVLGYASNINASDVVSKTNERRAGAGLAALTVNARLNQAALAKAQHMFENQYWAHVAPDGTQPWSFFRRAGYRYSVAGENLARDFDSTDSMMGAWMDSPTHRGNIMNGRYQEIGVGVVNGTLQGTETTLVVQLFGTPQAAAPKITDSAAVNASPKPKAVAKAASPKPKPTPVLGETEPTASPAAVTSPAPDEKPDGNTEVTLAQSGENGSSGGPIADAGEPNVLGSGVLPLGAFTPPPLFSPLQLSKAFFLAMIFVILATLVYDGMIIGHRSAVRLVGHNLAHILILLMTAFLVVFFRSGVIG